MFEEHLIDLKFMFIFTNGLNRNISECYFVLTVYVVKYYCN